VKTRLLTIALASVAIALAAPLPATAKDDDHAHGAEHGGQFVELDDHHGVEMVAGDTSLMFHLTDDHKLMNLTGGSFKAIVQTDAGTKMLPLAIDGSALKTALDRALPAGAKIVITGKDAEGHTIQARFVKK
jgi:hypothetical protein